MVLTGGCTVQTPHLAESFLCGICMFSPCLHWFPLGPSTIQRYAVGLNVLPIGGSVPMCKPCGRLVMWGTLCTGFARISSSCKGPLLLYHIGQHVKKGE